MKARILCFLSELCFALMLIYASMKESSYESKNKFFIVEISIHVVVKAAPFI